MYCSICGAQIPDNSAFCPTCGAQQNAASAGNAGSAAQFNVGTSYGAPDVPDYLVWNLLATLFCCLPFGIVGLVYSSKVGSAKARGDYQAAEAASSSAKIWLIVSVVCAAISIIAYVGLAVLGVAVENI